MTELEERRFFGDNITYNRRRRTDKPLLVVIPNKIDNLVIVLIPIFLIAYGLLERFL